MPRGTLVLAASEPRRLTYTVGICYNLFVPKLDYSGGCFPLILHDLLASQYIGERGGVNASCYTGSYIVDISRY